MKRLSDIGRIFYGIAMAALGLQTGYYSVFPYMLMPPEHFGAESLLLLTSISGMILILAGVCIVLKKMILPVALLLGTMLLLIFCFCYIPYELTASSHYLHLGEWENAEKELALSGGALIIAGRFLKEKALNPFLRKLLPVGAILFSITIVSFGMDHFLYAKDAAGYMPSWISHHLFWIYIAGIALLGSGTAIILKIRRRLFATLLGAMIFTWFIILHIPKVISAAPADRADEITSALLALAYSGIAFVIAGAAMITPFSNHHAKDGQR